MTLLDDTGLHTQRWSLSDRARYQIEEAGISLSELYRLLDRPQMKMPARGGERINGYGLTATLCGTTVEQVGIDGATSSNWRDWAVERAEFGDSDVAGADEHLKALMQRLTVGIKKQRPARQQTPSQKAIPKPRPSKPPVEASSVCPEVKVEIDPSVILERIHPKLRALVTRQADGDFTRLLIHSATRVEILPAGTGAGSA